jgi:endonuclease-3 related protein
MKLRSYFNALLEAYGPQRWWPAETALEVIVGAYLTQNTSWAAVERSIANLRGRGVLNLEGLRSVEEAELRKLIQPSGFMTRKASAIKAFIAWLDREYAGSLEVLAAQPDGATAGGTIGPCRGGRGNGGRDSSLCTWASGNGGG